ncbi:lysine-specific histone demethylase 1 homolog 2-like [Carex rostrata]
MDPQHASASPSSPSTTTLRSRPRRRAAASVSYDESLVDITLRDHLAPSPQSSRRRQLNTEAARQKETNTEAMIAFSLGFPIDAVFELERSTLSVPLDTPEQRNDYIVVRNHILATWRLDVRSWLSKSHIKATVASKYDKLVSAAHDFLSLEGYINFGVAPTFQITPDPTPSPSSPKASVLVIGAGLAGLAAARQLLHFGYKVLVLEGRARPGGRVFTYRTSGKSLELGGSVITGIHANPLGVLARQLGTPLHKVRDRCPLYMPDGMEVDAAADVEADSTFNNLLEHAARLREFLSQEKDLCDSISLGSALQRLRKLYGAARSPIQSLLLNWHMANLEYANAGCLTDLSLAHWDQDDIYEMGGDHCLLAGGNGRLIDALCEGIPILYEKTVTRIGYGGDGVRVVASTGQVFEADVALCTVPLGVLKRNLIKFEPELPGWKRQAIERLGFGLLNKVAMVFPYVFWGEDLDTFGCVNEESRKRGEFFLFYGYHTVAGGAVLIALVAGEAAGEFEMVDPVDSLNRVLCILRGIYSQKGVTVPDPIQSVCTRWGSDPFSYGSYSHVRVGSSGTDYDILSESLSGRLFFAGEATSRQYPATMHGAFMSGLREAACIVRATEDRLVSNPDLKRPIAKSSVSGDVLVKLFKEPDLAFGSFAFVFSEGSEDSNAMGLMRVSFQKPVNGNAGKGNSVEDQLYLYAIVSREQVEEMQVASADDKSRLQFLYNTYSVKLMGYNSTCEIGGSLIVSILKERSLKLRQNRPSSCKVRI